MAAPTILHLSPNPSDYVTVPRASTTVFDHGWLVSLESSNAVNLDAATEDATFIGVAITKHESGNTDNVTVCQDCVMEIDAVSAAYDTGDGVKYSAGSATVDYKVAADGGANTIGWAHKVYSSATRIQVRFNVLALGKLYAVSA